jgi:hypothetical protein
MILNDYSVARNPYLYLIFLSTFLLLSSCSTKYQLRKPSGIGNFELKFSEVGIEPVEYGNIPEPEWWESFYIYIGNIESSDLGNYLQFELDSKSISLVDLIETRGEQFYSNQFGIIRYLSFGNNSEPIANISYFRILNSRSTSGSKRLDLLIEKGVETSWRNIQEKIKTNGQLDKESQNKSTPWILYRFLISKVIDDQRGLLNRAFLISCDKYYCLTGMDGTRRVFLSGDKKRYDDLIIPENEGYPIVDKIFKNAISAYDAHYKSLR